MEGVVKRLNWANGARSFSSGVARSASKQLSRDANLKTSMNKVVVGHSKVKDGYTCPCCATTCIHRRLAWQCKDFTSRDSGKPNNSRFFSPRCIAIHGLVTFLVMRY